MDADAEHRKAAGGGDRADARYGGNTVAKTLKELDAGRSAAIGRWREREEVGKDVARVVAGIGGAERGEGANQEPGAGREDEREGDFDGHERGQRAGAADAAEGQKREDDRHRYADSIEQARTRRSTDSSSARGSLAVSGRTACSPP